MAENSPTDISKKWWWLAAVVVPIAVAVINNVSDILHTEGGGGGDTTYVFGPQFNDAVTFNTFNIVVDQANKAGIELSESELETLRQALNLVQARHFDAAIPLLQSLEEVAPVPAVLNSLGNAHLATGDCEVARRYFQAMIDRNPNAQAAQNNLGMMYHQGQGIE